MKRLHRNDKQLCHCNILSRAWKTEALTDRQTETGRQTDRITDRYRNGKHRPDRKKHETDKQKDTDVDRAE